MKNKVVIISGPSAIGKTSICNSILKLNKNYNKIITCTTRLTRDTEEDKNSYIFFSEKEFKKNVAENKFLEYSNVYNFYYGVLRSEFEKSYQNFFVSIVLLNTEGTQKIIDYCKKKVICCKSIFLSINQAGILEKRLLEREKSVDFIPKRILEVANEMKKAKFFDKIILNNDFDKCVQDVQDFIKSDD